MEKKICIKCDLEKEISYFYKSNNQCKSCKILYQKKLQEVKILGDSKLESKKCSCCDIEKDIILFNKYGSKCKDCEILYYQKNK